jgi:hypothetical protein
MQKQFVVTIEDDEDSARPFDVGTVQEALQAEMDAKSSYKASLTSVQELAPAPPQLVVAYKRVLGSGRDEFKLLRVDPCCAHMATALKNDRPAWIALNDEGWLCLVFHAYYGDDGEQEPFCACPWCQAEVAYAEEQRVRLVAHEKKVTETYTTTTYEEVPE